MKRTILMVLVLMLLVIFMACSDTVESPSEEMPGAPDIANETG